MSTRWPISTHASWHTSLILTLALVAVSCGGGGATPGNPGAAKTLIVFPPGNALTQAPTIAVRGVLANPSSVLSVLVGGVPATSTDGFVTWRATVPLADGDNDIELLVDRGTGSTEESSVLVRREGPLVAPFSFDATLDATTGVLYTVHGGAVISVDLATGARRLITDALRVDGFEARISVDETTGLLYVSDRPGPDTHRISVVDPSTGIVTILAETGDGNGVDIVGNTTNSHAAPVVVDPVAGLALVLDKLRLGGVDNRVIGVDLVTGARTLLGSTPVGTSNEFVDIAAAPGTGTAILFDRGTSTIQSLNLTTGVLTARGTGVAIGSRARFSVDVIGDVAYGAPTAGDVVAVDLATGIQTVISLAPASDPELARVFNNDVWFHAGDGELYALSDNSTALIQIDPTTGTRTLLYRLGSRGEEVDADDLVVADDGRVVFCDSSDHLVRRVDLPGITRSIVSGDVVGSGPAFDEPQAIAFTENQDAVYIGNSSLAPNDIYLVDLATGSRQVISGAAVGTGVDIEYSIDMDRAADGTLYIVDEDDCQIVAVDPTSGDRRRVAGVGVGSGPDLDGMNGCDYDDATQTLYVCEDALVLAVNVVSGDRTVVLDGATLAPPLRCADIVVNEDGSVLHVFDSSDGRVHRIDVATGTPTLIHDPATTTGYRLRRADRAFARPHGVLFVTDNYYDALMAVDAETGEAVIVDR